MKLLPAWDTTTARTTIRPTMMNNKNWYSFEFVAYTLFAALSAGTVLYLFYYSPVNYTALITEDHIAEYMTAVSFLLAGVILIIVSFVHGTKANKIILMLTGLLALLIGAEEMSWGQRIFNVDTPGMISEHNLQGEVTLHNLAAFDSVNSNLHLIASCLILTYLCISLLAQTSMPRLKAKLTKFGLPLIPVRLIPVFLLAPYFFIFYPTAKADEIGELFLGIAVLMWAVDLFLVSSKDKHINSIKSVLIMICILSLAVILSGILTYRYSYGLGGRLNLMASRDYPALEMYDQADSIYTYIYQNPHYLAPETRINHARMLQLTGKSTEAEKILVDAASHLEKKEPFKNSNSKQLRLLGITYMLMGQDTLSDSYFNKSIDVEQNVLSQSSTPDDKAKALWSISKTMKARGDIKSAITSMEQAIKHAQSPALQHKLEDQLEELSNYR